MIDVIKTEQEFLIVCGALLPERFVYRVWLPNSSALSGDYIEILKSNKKGNNFVTETYKVEAGLIESLQDKGIFNVSTNHPKKPVNRGPDAIGTFTAIELSSLGIELLKALIDEWEAEMLKALDAAIASGQISHFKFTRMFSPQFHLICAEHTERGVEFQTKYSTSSFMMEYHRGGGYKLELNKTGNTVSTRHMLSLLHGKSHKVEVFTAIDNHNFLAMPRNQIG